MSSTSIKAPPTRKFCSNPWSRIIWKEFRQNLPLLFVFVGLMFVVAAVQYRATLPSMELWCSGSWIVLCLFALSTGIYLFSPEFENKTSSLLQQLPVSSGFIVRNKILIGVGYLFFFVIVACLLQAFQVFGLGYSLNMVGDVFDSENQIAHATMIFVAIVIPMECFVYGTICSLSIKKPIFATVAAVGLFLLSWLLVLIIAAIADAFMMNASFIAPSSVEHGQQGSGGRHILWAIVATKSLTLLLLGGTVIPLGRTWLGNAPQIGPTNQLLAPINSQTKHQNIANDYTQSGDSAFSRDRVRRSLIWQTFRQQRAHIIVSAALIGLGAICSWTSISFNADLGSHARPHLFIAAAQSCAVWMGLICLICGLLAFAADNQNEKYRFFQQHGDFPWAIWAIRLAPAFLLTLFCFAIVFGQYFHLKRIETEFASYGMWFFDSNAVALQLLLIVFSGFAIGQYNSIFFKSIVYSIGMNLVLALGLWFWFMVLNKFHGNFLAYFIPIPLAMCIATWLWSPHWIAGENKTVRVLIPHAIVAGLTSILVVTFVALNWEFIKAGI